MNTVFTSLCSMGFSSNITIIIGLSNGSINPDIYTMPIEFNILTMFICLVGMTIGFIKSTN